MPKLACFFCLSEENSLKYLSNQLVIILGTEYAIKKHKRDNKNTEVLNLRRFVMNAVPINIKADNTEIFARIVKAAAFKYDCSVSIDFSDGRHRVEFIGDELLRPHIIEEALGIFDQ